MNPPHHPDTALGALADAFDTLLHTLDEPDTSPHHLSEPLAKATVLAARLAAKVHDAHRALAASAPADRPSHATTATKLCDALGAAGHAISNLAYAQDAHLFIDHFPDRHGHPEVNTAYARTRIAAHLAAARDSLTEAAGQLRHPTHTAPSDPLLHAAHARSPHATNTADTNRSSPPPPTTSSPAPPHRGPKR